MSSCSCIVNQSYSQQQASQSINLSASQTVSESTRKSVTKYAAPSMLVDLPIQQIERMELGGQWFKLHSLKSFTFICCVRMSQLHYQGCTGFINLIQKGTCLVKM